MKTKDILGPTRFKIVFTIFIIALFYFALGPREVLTTDLGSGIGIVSPLGIESTPIFILIALIVSYLLSCLIILALKKSR